jgi:gluconolactonase
MKAIYLQLAWRVAASIVLGLATAAVRGEVGWEAPNGVPSATVDLATDADARLVKGAWRYSDTRIVARQHRRPDAMGQPTGEPIQTYDFTPHAGAADYDDSGWEVIPPTSLAPRRSTGRLCFNWYRIRLTIPERVGDFPTAGSTVVFETALDDYAEVWVNGELPRGIGQSGGSILKGWNAPNRLIIGRGVKPGQ